MKPPSIVIDHFLSTKWSKKLFTINHYELQNGKCIVTQELSAYDKDTTGNESDGYTKDEHKKMDLHNNEIGRKLGADNLSAPEEKMAEIIYDEIMREDSLFVWLHE